MNVKLAACTVGLRRLTGPRVPPGQIPRAPGDAGGCRQERPELRRGGLERNAHRQVQQPRDVHARVRRVGIIAMRWYRYDATRGYVLHIHTAREKESYARKSLNRLTLPLRNTYLLRVLYDFSCFSVV